MTLPKILTEITNKIKISNVVLSKRFDDGRINASINEDEVINEIVKHFDIDLPRSRAWFDFSINDNGSFYPVNIKITNTHTADNLNCKMGIYYALTGRLPDFPNKIAWLQYFEKLKENLGKEKNKDYYFLVSNKQDTTDVFLNSLKGLSKLQPNGNNLPFQCRWDLNRTYSKTTFNDSKDNILKVFGESIKLRAEIYFNFKRIFPEYV